MGYIICLFDAMDRHSCSTCIQKREYGKAEATSKWCFVKRRRGALIEHALIRYIGVQIQVVHAGLQQKQRPLMIGGDNLSSERDSG